MDPRNGLGNRERQILEILYRSGEATVEQVRDQILNPPSYSAVRGMLGLLERKKLVRHRQEKLHYVYQPTIERGKARLSALRQMVDTFFEGSLDEVVTALFQVSDAKLSPRSIKKIREMIADASKEGR